MHADYIAQLYNDDRDSNGTAAAAEKRVEKKKNSVFHVRYAKHRANDDDAERPATDANNALPPPYVRCGWHGDRRNRRATAAAVEQTVGNGGERFVGGGFGEVWRDGAGYARTRRARGMRLRRCVEKREARLPGEGNGDGTAATPGGPISRYFSFICFPLHF